MPTISVIVPVYKVEPYLDRCVESIVRQTFEDFELFLVDDGSPDNCGRICDEWAKKDRRIRVIHKENSGVSDARNVAIEVAQGEYVIFVDSDDYIHPQLLEALYQAVQQHGVKVAVSDFVRTHGEDLEEQQSIESRLWTPEELYSRRCVNATVAWGKLYHRSVVLPYPPGKLHEDEYVTYRILFGQERIAVTEAALYGYFTNANGIMGQGWSPARLDLFAAMEQQIAFFEEKGYRQLAYRRITDYIEILCWQMRCAMALADPGERKRYTAICRETLRRCIRTYQKKGYANLLDHFEGYRTAWPNRVGWFKLKIRVRTAGSRLKQWLRGGTGK